MKLMSREYGVTRYRVVANMVNSVAEGEYLFQKISRVAARFLDVTLDYAGHVPMDEYLRRAVQKQRAVVEAYPRARSASAFKNLARTVDRWPMPANARGHLEFFVERLVRPDYEPPRIAV
jgi:flagellar biosynthesis protein FlhG